MVYVQSIDGKALMPCSEAKARHLLKEHRARRVKNTPFTIKLKFVVDGHTPPVSQKDRLIILSYLPVMLRCFGAEG